MNSQAKEPPSWVSKDSREGAENSTTLDQLNENAKTLLGLQQYELAEEAYAVIRDKFPQDYRGWWGLVVSKSKNFSQQTENQNQMNSWYLAAVSLASPEQSADIQSSYLAYLLQIAMNEGFAEESGRVNRRIESLKNAISPLTAKISEIENQIRIMSNSVDQQKKSLQAHISDYQQRLKHDESRVRPMGLWDRLRKDYYQEDLAYQIKDLKKQITIWQAAIKELEDQHERNLRGPRANIAAVKEQIAKLKSEIDDCTAYLSLGKDAIGALCFAEMCEGIRLSQPRDENTVALRAKALGADDCSETSASDLIVLSCPACGSPIQGNRKDLLTAGHVVCSNCHADIQVLSKSE